jgi:hypothetical protein
MSERNIDARVVAAIRQTLQEIRADIRDLRTDLRGEAEAIADLATRADIAALRADLVPLASKADVAVLVSEAKFELVKWIVGIAIAQVGTVIAVLKLFPATGHG